MAGGQRFHCHLICCAECAQSSRGLPRAQCSGGCLELRAQGSALRAFTGLVRDQIEDGGGDQLITHSEFKSVRGREDGSAMCDPCGASAAASSPLARAARVLR